jgi:hypothetical protein
VAEEADQPEWEADQRPLRVLIPLGETGNPGWPHKLWPVQDMAASIVKSAYREIPAAPISQEMTILFEGDHSVTHSFHYR